jgi:hypothetical protein
VCYLTYVLYVLNTQSLCINIILVQFVLNTFELFVVPEDGWSVHSKRWTFQNQVHNAYPEIFSTQFVFVRLELCVSLNYPLLLLLNPVIILIVFGPKVSPTKMQYGEMTNCIKAIKKETKSNYPRTTNASRTYMLTQE